MSADFFETIGTSIYNIILLTYAKTFIHPKIFVSVVTLSMLIPGIFNFLLGKLSDQTKRKSMNFTLMKFCQFLLYMLLAIVILKKSITTFIIVILINIISDFLGLYCGALRVSIIQNRIDSENRQQTIGLSSVISALVVPLGQSIGVIILKITKAYYLAAIANALSFLISGLITFFGQKSIYYYGKTALEAEEPPHKINKNKLEEVIYKVTTLPFLNFMICFGLMNAVGASIDSVINLFYVSYPHSTPFSFGVTLLIIINTAFIVGSVLGNISNFSWLKNKSVRELLFYSSLLIMGIYLNFLLLKNFWITVLLMFTAAVLLGFLNPFLDSKLMEITDPDIIGTMWGIMGTLTSVSVPFGSVVLILIYNTLSPQLMFIIAILLIVLALTALVLNGRKEAKK